MKTKMFSHTGFFSKKYSSAFISKYFPCIFLILHGIRGVCVRSGLRFTKWGVILILICFASQKILADIRYVNVNNGSPAAPYTSWATAANNIQDAVDAAVTDDIVLVTNGVYNSGSKVYTTSLASNRVVITKAITVRSVNGPESTIIAGSGPIGNSAVRCVFLTNDSALIGFTLSNGHTRSTGSTFYDTSGGGAFLSIGSVVSNCVITMSRSKYFGGGAACNFGGTVVDSILRANISELYAGGAFCRAGGTIKNCSLENNSADRNGGGIACNDGGLVTGCTIISNSADRYFGGGVYCFRGGIITNCLITENKAGFEDTEDGCGGGVYLSDTGFVYNCTISKNHARISGGGIYFSTSFKCIMNNSAVMNNVSSNGTGGGVNCGSGAIINNCIISGNAAPNSSGGGVICRYSTLNNCLIKNNWCDNDGGGIFISSGGTIVNCTIVSNTAVGAGTWAEGKGGGVYCSSGGDIRNSIIYFNTALIGDNWTNYLTGMSFDYSCTTPTNMLPGGTGCIADNPLFADVSNEDFHLLSYSPCVNTGNNAYTNTLIDLSGWPRIINNNVDMGCYEFSYPPQIATNALIFPAKNSIIFASTSTNIIWDAERITDDVDGTNLNITLITLHYADTTNFILEITNNIANVPGKIEMNIPDGNWDGLTNYVLKFEVVDSLSLTNSSILWDNVFAIVPEPCYLLFIVGILILFFGKIRLKL